MEHRALLDKIERYAAVIRDRRPLTPDEVKELHPFQDGNRRTARLLMNLLLVRNGYCLVSIPPAQVENGRVPIALAQWEVGARNRPEYSGKHSKMTAFCV